ncbi:hypothetical protein C8Q74DRAFT_1274790, partial [Fomes fomentarius]
LLDSRVLCALTITVSVYLVLAILILIWSLLGSAATLWSSVAPSLRALVTWGLFVDSFIQVCHIFLCLWSPASRCVVPIAFPCLSAGSHLACYSEPAWPSLSYPGH